MHGDEVTRSDLDSVKRGLDSLRYEIERKIEDLEHQLRQERDARRSAVQEVWNTLGNDAKVTGMEDDE